MAIASIPAARLRSIHAHSSSGFTESSRLNGSSGTALPRKMTLRWRFWFSGLPVNSYAMNVVKRPGSLWRSAAATVSRQVERTTPRSSSPSRRPSVWARISRYASRRSAPVNAPDRMAVTSSVAGWAETACSGSIIAGSMPRKLAWSVTA